MKPSYSISLVLVCIAANSAGFSSEGWAQAPNCNGVISASARAPNGANLVPPQNYNTEDVARRNAITAWEKLVAKDCPSYAPVWKRSSKRNALCEGYAGGVSCEVRAQPGTR